MKNLIEYLKDKIYYVMGATIVIIILLIIISSCSGKKVDSYSAIELKMQTAAENYYESRKDRLPKDEKTSVQVSLGTLIDSELMKEVVDPENKNQTCSGYVQVKKVGKEYVYTPFLTCKGNYEPKFLTDVIKRVKLDEYGNGVYEMNGEYIYRGDDVKNYVKFNDQLWRIIKVDKDGDIKIVSANRSDDTYVWDDAYNSERDDTVGITTDYIHTDIRKVLVDYYKKSFSKESKSKIVSKDLCVGRMLLTDQFSAERECSVIKSNEKVGLLLPSDYKNACLDSGCVNLDSMGCINQNYLADVNNINTWLLTSSSENTYKVYNLNSIISESNASNERRLNYVIYVNSDSIVASGNGTQDNPYIIK